jgi:prepilin-type N-terminal cleavage/methylation domain-containing protein
MTRSSIMRRSTRVGRQHQAGLSLIELMITLVLGLIIIAAVFNMYTGNSRSARFTEGLQTMQENGRYGVSVLQRGLRLAGYSQDGYIDAFDIANSAENTIVVRSEQAFDCNGGDTVSTDGLAINTYRHNDATKQLTCEGNVAGAVEMSVVDGVDEFRILYGIDADGDETTSEPQRYIAYNNAINPAQVVSLRFSLLVNSDKPIRTRKANKTYVVLDKQVPSNDRIAREVYSSTVKLRNRE